MKRASTALNFLFCMAAVLIITASSLWAAGCDCSNQAATGIPQTECEALLTIFNSTGGASWTNKSGWNTDSGCNLWNGVAVKNGHVTGLELYQNELSGQLPGVFGKLPYLKKLDLCLNPNLTGSIPDSIGQLHQLTYIDLADCSFTGSIPESITGLVLLEQMILGYNNLSGPIPADIGNLVNLTFLEFADNKLSGEVPASITKLTKIARNYLMINNNSLTSSDAQVISYLDEKCPGWKNTQTSPAAVTAVLTNKPSAATTSISENITVSGTGVVSYKYRLDSSSWSGERAVTQTIVLQNLATGSHKLEVAGKNSDDVWQEQATECEWNILPVLSQILNAPTGVINRPDLEISIGGLDITAYKHRLNNGQWSGETPVANKISLHNMAYGAYQLEVLGKDSFGKWQSETDPTRASWTVKGFAGDINGSGKTDLADSIIILQLMSGITVKEEIHLDADVNRDGRAGLEEAIFSMRNISSK